MTRRSSLRCALANLSKEPKAEIVDAWRLTLNRLPTAAEMRKAEAFLEKRTEAERRTALPQGSSRTPLVRSITSELTGAEVKIQEEEEIGNYEENVKPGDVSPAVRALAELTLILFNSNEFLYVY